MSIGSLGGLIGSVAGTSLAQSKGTDIDRAHQDDASHQRQVSNNLKAESAAGIGQTDGEDHQAADRDADGRRLWEAAAGKPSVAAEPSESSPPLSKDTTGQSGTQLDLCG